MLTLGVALMLVPVVLLPHFVAVHQVAPMNAAMIWLFALMLRATITVGAAVFVFVYLPQTALFHVLSHWCLHTVLPMLNTHFGLPGQSFADVALVLPALALAASLLWVMIGVVRAGVSLHLFIRRRSRGNGPGGSTIVDDESLLIGVPAFGRGRVVVSQAALDALDGEELAASLAHETGHLARRHRPILIAARLLRSLARPLPGTRRAERELIFNLERDADEYAVADTRDPLALASAICKAATEHRPTPALASLEGDGHVGLRLEYLLSGGYQRAGARGERAARWLAGALAVATVAVALAVPIGAFAAAGTASDAPVMAACPD